MKKKWLAALAAMAVLALTGCNNANFLLNLSGGEEEEFGALEIFNGDTKVVIDDNGNGSLPLGNVVLGDEVDEKEIILTLKNMGNGALRLKDILVNNYDEKGVFYLTPLEERKSIGVGKSASYKVTYVPNEPGWHYGALTITTDDPKHKEVTIRLTGQGVNGPTPSLTIYDSNESVIANGDELDFGSVAVGETSLRMEIILKNTGDAHLMPEEYSLTCTPLECFDVTFDTENLTIAGGDNLSCYVTYTPESVGLDDTATLTIASVYLYDGSQTRTITLKGTGNPKLTIHKDDLGDTKINNDDELYFGFVTIDGEPSTSDKSIKLKNCGRDVLHLSDVDIIMEGEGENFSIKSVITETDSIQADGSLTYSITYAPEIVGRTDTAMLTIKSGYLEGGKIIINLKGRTAPDNMEIDPDGALTKYTGNENETKVLIPEGVTSIGQLSFSTCKGLTSVKIPDSVESIGKRAFGNCDGLTSVEIGEGVTSIGQYAFQGCTNLANVNIPDSVTDIGECAFSYCKSLTEVTIPGGVTSIEFWAFGQCTSLTSVTISYGVESIGEDAFSNCTSLTDVTIPSSVTSIGESAFFDCKGLMDVTIGEGVKSIGELAFYGCESLTSVKIPDGVESIGGSAFNSCYNLTAVTIPVSVTSIGVGAFNLCNNLETVNYGGTEKEWKNISGISGSSLKYITITGKDGSTWISE